MAGRSFLRARSPVTPNITMEPGPAMRGRRRSRGSRSGFGASVPGRWLGESVTIVLSRTAAREHGPPWWRAVLPTGSSAGGLDGLGDRGEQFVPRLLELLDDLALEHGEDVGEVHAGLGDPLEHGLGRGGLLRGQRRLRLRVLRDRR